MSRSTEPTALLRSERSSPLRRARRTHALAALGLLLVGAKVSAEPPRHEGTPTDASLATAPRSATAKLVLVGAVADEHELGLLFGELLGRQGVAVEISRAERFDPASLFGVEEPGVTRVFVVMIDAHAIRLHFRGPNDERYLLRKVTLPNGLDAVGRELLGQVVESSVVALLHSTEGLSREEATAELARDDAATRATAEPLAANAAPPPEAAPAALRRQPSPWEFHLGLRYAATWSGADFGIEHGPGLAAGARYRPGVSLGVELGVERYFARSLSSAALEADVQNSSFYGLIEAGLALSHAQSGFVAFGPALELSRTQPASGPADVTLAAPTRELAPALRFELRYELAAGRWLFGAAALLQLSLVKTSYELVVGDEHQVLAAPALLRPGAVLTVGVR